MAKPLQSERESVPGIVRDKIRSLDMFFHPAAVAVIGASETAGSVGRAVLSNLISHPFGGMVFPVNLKRRSVLGIQAYPSVLAVPEEVELALIATPAATVPDIIHECTEKGVQGAIILSAGFRERGEEGEELERKVLAEARRGKLRIIGPNCLGLMSPITGLHATFANTAAIAGSVGFISQSGALCTAVLDWSLRERVGFSAFVSIGSMADVGWGDLIDYLGDDPHTRSIVIYMESIGDARSFLSAAREVALTKPIIVLKVGRSEAAAHAAASHTGTLVGSDKVLDAAFRRCGVLRVDRVEELFDMAEILAKQPRPSGPRLAIVTNAGGPGVLATDALIGEGGELADLSKQTIDALNQFLPPHWSHANPVDIIGDADAERYIKAVEVVSRDANTDGLLAILTPQAMTDPTQTAERLKAYGRLEGKPILASWMGGASVTAGESILTSANIPTFAYPDSAARAFLYMWKYSYNLRALYETPHPPLETAENLKQRALAGAIVQKARSAGRTILTERESKDVLACYGIPTVPTFEARSADDAVSRANQIGYPVVLKLLSETITHKTDVGGVRLNLRDEEDVRRAYLAIQDSVRQKAGPENFAGVTVQAMILRDGYELIIGSSFDSQFGPVLLFGAGGEMVEVFQDRALALPPLNTTLARRMMEQTRIFYALGGTRGRPPVDLGALEQLLVRFSHLVTDQRGIKEIDMNPLQVSAERLIALDARIILHDPQIREEELPKLAIRPYPASYISSGMLPDGESVALRPIRPDDEPMMIRFHKALSEQSVYYRYFGTMSLSQRTAHERLTRMCFIDYDRELALVAVRKDSDPDRAEIIAVGRLIKLHGSPDAEIAVLVADSFQGKRLGTDMVSRLLRIARQEGVRRICAEILPENHLMQRICQKLGFQLHHELGGHIVRAEIAL
ncbi:MAG: bifunctional acetate--CoA ligase family protein/GNAT family N-acetyltransferase [Acidobacteria bacterium]|nr:bifunctional acetate--CoA ligase family protein/GNAT family N-acetyltransferase [Acidobacteriota bacterium]